ncbi:MAG: orotate phosphoribosyltransferase [Nitrospinaceae bacterium]|nr:MAG: orotate phosphoribosyltransferase [Nitrospinaceae bacterium]
MTVSEQLADIALQIGAIRIDTDNPFTWASGYRMPIYNDNRLFLGNADHRLLIARGFQSLIMDGKIVVDVVAGTATAGIPPATTLANLIEVPLIYVRPTAKKHGMKNQIEGVLKKEQNVVVIEDLVSTGGSALNAVMAIRELGGRVDHCFSIFNYGFQEADDRFKEFSCQLHSLLTFENLIDHAESIEKFTEPQLTLLRSWLDGPFSWGENHGFPRQTQ